MFFRIAKFFEQHKQRNFENITKLTNFIRMKEPSTCLVDNNQSIFRSNVIFINGCFSEQYLSILVNLFQIGTNLTVNFHHVMKEPFEHIFQSLYFRTTESIFNNHDSNFTACNKIPLIEQFFQF